MTSYQDRKKTGSASEELAGEYLKSKGYSILHRNLKLKLGEIDIVAKEGETLCFIEVRSKTTDHSGTPFESVSFQKQRQLSRLALAYLQDKYHSLDVKCRFDVVSVVIKDDGTYEIELIQNAFDFCR